MQYTTCKGKVRKAHLLFYQDFKDTFVCNTQPITYGFFKSTSCFIRISKILLYAIHNLEDLARNDGLVVLSGFQRYFCMQYTTGPTDHCKASVLFYQDFKDTFVCNTQPESVWIIAWACCFIRISKILLYAIHNQQANQRSPQRLFYQDFKDTFVCNTQPILVTYTLGSSCFIRISKILLYAIHNIINILLKINNVVLSGFQRYFCMQYTTLYMHWVRTVWLFYQDFKDTFVCNTQHIVRREIIRLVVLSGFQRYFCMQYTTVQRYRTWDFQLFYQDFKDTFVCNTQHIMLRLVRAPRCFIRISKILLYAIHNVIV